MVKGKAAEARETNRRLLRERRATRMACGVLSCCCTGHRMRGCIALQSSTDALPDFAIRAVSSVRRNTRRTARSCWLTWRIT
eukprot:3227804-Prymnesium_polylepis.1